MSVLTQILIATCKLVIAKLLAHTRHCSGIYAEHRQCKLGADGPFGGRLA
jgi:hypothetical protein